MTSQINMIKFEPDMVRLSEWAYSRNLVKRGGDLGYALHGLLKACFGDLAPQPFSLQQKRGQAMREDGHSYSLLAYSHATKDQLLAQTQHCSDDAAVEALQARELRHNSMPEKWIVGRTFEFEVRVRPVIRQDADGRRDATVERDAFLVACDCASSDMLVSRQQVYGDWLRKQFSRLGGAKLVQRGDELVTLAAFQRTRIARRDKTRKLREIDGPDATLRGVLEVTDSEAFSGLVERGIGRHRAFGFGMILLRPLSTGHV